MQVSLDIANYAISDVIFYRTYVKIFIEKSNTDSYREGQWVLIARTGKLACPVSMIKRGMLQKRTSELMKTTLFFDR